MPGTDSSASAWSPKVDNPGNCIEIKVLERQFLDHLISIRFSRMTVYRRFIWAISEATCDCVPSAAFIYL
jgi:hypothetical protein